MRHALKKEGRRRTFVFFNWVKFTSQLNLLNVLGFFLKLHSDAVNIHAIHC